MKNPTPFQKGLLYGAKLCLDRARPHRGHAGWSRTVSALAWTAHDMLARANAEPVDGSDSVSAINETELSWMVADPDVVGEDEGGSL